MLRGAADCQQSTNKTQIDDLRISNCERAMKIVLAIVRFCDKPTFDTWPLLFLRIVTREYSMM